MALLLNGKIQTLSPVHEQRLTREFRDNARRVARIVRIPTRLRDPYDLARHLVARNVSVRTSRLASPPGGDAAGNDQVLEDGGGYCSPSVSCDNSELFRETVLPEHLAVAVQAHKCPADAHHVNSPRGGIAHR